ncbi:MAG: rod shape-determining protein MreC [Paludibacteraceae bacterium]|nr:rod shape-determining protein MreC [Paludibacteraceae bacterium]
MILEFICVVMMVSNNQFQRFKILTSTNYAMGSIYSMRANVVRYFSLTDINDNLSSQNAYLQSELTKARTRIAQLEADTSYIRRKTYGAEKNYTFISARVVNVSTDAFKNLITIDKGSNDGIRRDMGVICEKGVVGLVSNVNENYSIVIPIINTVSEIGAKVKNTSCCASMKWEGNDVRYASLEEVPIYTTIADGDTVTTSGCSSTIFPEGIMIGIIDKHKKGNKDFFDIDVKLSTDFLGLNFVDIIDYKGALEEKQLEEENK